MPDTVADFRGGVYHSGTHYSREISLNLEIYIIGMGIVFPMSRGRWQNPVKDIIPG